MNDCGNLQYAHVLNAIPVPIFIVDEDVRIMDSNAAAERAFGLSRDAIRSRRGGEVLSCLHSQDVPEGCGRGPACKSCVIRNSVSNCLGAVTTTQRRMKFQIRTEAKKTDLELLISASRLPEAGTDAVLLTIEDITEFSKLKAIIPICSHCKRIRNEAEYWEQVDKYFHDHTGVDFSHGMCPVCLEQFYGEYLHPAAEPLEK
jgi:transcriptional regulator of aromatic amino acid metabolism